MKTKHKIILAKTAYKLVHALRTGLGLPDVAVFRRSGLIYELDLAQGIDFSIFALGHFEPSTVKALRRLVKPGFMVVDVGANIGAHTIGLAHLVGPKGRVVACEPTDFAFRKLLRNLSLNPQTASRVLPVQCFLGHASDHEIPGSIYSGWPLSGGEDVHPKHLGTEESTSNATHRTLDEVVTTAGLQRVDLIKMDVDGFECDVLSGAENVMRSYKPIFVMEISPYVLKERGSSLKQFLDFFSVYNYRFYDEVSERPIIATESAIISLIGDGASKNVIARAD